jgi:hypothetical protein
MVRRLLHAERRGVLVILIDIFFSDFERRNTFLTSAGEDLIVDVCKVLYEIYLHPPIFEITAECIENDEWPSIADMKIIVYGRAAYVDPDFITVKRDKLFLFMCQRIVYSHFGPFTLYFFIEQYQTASLSPPFILS